MKGSQSDNCFSGTLVEKDLLISINFSLKEALNAVNSIHLIEERGEVPCIHENSASSLPRFRHSRCTEFALLIQSRRSSVSESFRKFTRCYIKLQYIVTIVGNNFTNRLTV